MNISYIDNFETWKNSFKESFPVKVRFSETDAFGHVNNTKVFTFLEEGRIEFAKKIGLMQEWVSESDAIWVNADIQCNYLHPMYFDDRLEVYVKISYIGTTSLDLNYMIENQNGVVCLTGRGRMVQINKKTGKPLKWSPEMLEKLDASFSSTKN